MNHTDHVSLLRPANLSPGGIWADFGAGSGAFTLALRELVGAEAEVYAVDKDFTRLEELERSFRQRFGSPPGANGSLHLLQADFARTLELPPLDGAIMANSLHYFREKERLLRHVGACLRPDGTLLVVEYNVDSGNPWVPHPLSFETLRSLAPSAGFSTPRLLATHPSRFLREFYSAIAHKL